MNGRFQLDDTSLHLSAACLHRSLMLLDNVEPLHHDPVISAIDTLDDAPQAPLLTGNNLDRITSFNPSSHA
jgi:hypothetical protein